MAFFFMRLTHCAMFMKSVINEDFSDTRSAMYLVAAIMPVAFVRFFRVMTFSQQVMTEIQRNSIELFNVKGKCGCYQFFTILSFYITVILLLMV